MFIDYNKKLLISLTKKLALDYGIATGGGADMLDDTTKDWESGSLQGCLIKIIAGTGIGQIRIIQSNVQDSVWLVDAWTTIPDTTSEYVIYAGELGISQQTFNGSLPALTGAMIFRSVLPAPTNGILALYAKKVVGMVYTDQDSAEGGLIIWQSPDNANWDYWTNFSVLANTVFPFSVDIVGKYVKVSYDNGPVDQTFFRSSVSLQK
jgi:hypothetical protein